MGCSADRRACSCCCRASNRLDWMYQGGMVAKAEADKRNEEQMLGARPVELEQRLPPPPRPARCAPASVCAASSRLPARC